MGFTLTFDPALLTFKGVRAGGDLTLVTIDGQPTLFVPYHHEDDCGEVEAYIADKGLYRLAKA